MSCALHALFAALLAPNADETTKLLTRILTMSESLNTKVGTLTTKIDEQSQKLDAAAQRDAVQAQTLSDLRVELENLRNVVVPLPVDTSVAEAAIDSAIAKLDANDARIDALDAAAPAPAPAPVPVPTEPTPAPTPVEPGAPVETAAQPD